MYLRLNAKLIKLFSTAHRLTEFKWSDYLIPLLSYHKIISPIHFESIRTSALIFPVNREPLTLVRQFL